MSLNGKFVFLSELVIVNDEAGVVHVPQNWVSLCDAFRFIEGDFDTYVKRIQEPYVWGGEPELIMASHVLKWVLDDFSISCDFMHTHIYFWYGLTYMYKNNITNVKTNYHLVPVFSFSSVVGGMVNCHH